MGMTLARQGQFEQALAAFEEAVRLKPDWAEGHFGLGMTLLSRGRPEPAARALRRAIDLQPHYPEALVGLGEVLQRQHRADEAAKAYRQAIALSPNHAPAHIALASLLHSQGKVGEAVAAAETAAAAATSDLRLQDYLGNLLASWGRFEPAIACFRAVVEAQPTNAPALYNLANSLRAAAHHDEAIQQYEHLLTIEPGHASALNNLGNLLQASGRRQQAIECYRKAIELDPKVAALHNNLANCLRAEGRDEDAAAAYQRAIELDPKQPAVHNNLANSLEALDRHYDAIDAYQRAIALQPDRAEFHYNLGNSLRQLGREHEAIAAYQRALSLQSDHVEALYNMGNLLQTRGQEEEAIACYEKAIERNPKEPALHNNLGLIYRVRGAHDKAIECYQRASALAPDFAPYLMNLGTSLKGQGRHEEALQAYRESLRLAPNFAAGSSNLLLMLNYHTGFSPREVFEEHLRYGQQHASPLAAEILPHELDPNPDRPMRVGYVSGDFKSHSVGFFIESIFAAHTDQVKLICYSDVERADAITHRIRQNAKLWRNISGFSDKKAAGLIRQDRVDILVDLSGHTAAGHRMLLFARKPAPIQLTYLGYPNTTGIAAIDYRITDSYADPPGMTEQFHTEQLLRLDPCAWCYQAAPDACEITGPPAMSADHVTFGSFNNIAKVNAKLIALWSRLLLRVPGSRLFFKERSLDDPTSRARVVDLFRMNGIGEDRLDLRGWEPQHQQHLEAYNHVDVALDTYPYHGTTTTCEAIWMGVPVVTLAGKTHVSRVGVSLLSNVGLDELISCDEEQFLNIAAGLAQDLPRLAQLRHSLRPRLAASPLMDAVDFVARLERAYRQVWRRWCSDAQRKKHG